MTKLAEGYNIISIFSIFITSNLTGELKETFEKLGDSWNEYAELCDKEVFIHAFRLGMQIAIAAMSDLE